MNTRTHLAPSGTEWQRAFPTQPQAATLMRSPSFVPAAQITAPVAFARMGQAEPTTQDKKAGPSWYQLSAADLVTLSGYGLGIWWCLGGPTWAGITSIVADEVDGRLARATGIACDRGGELDWGVDVALVPLSLLRLGREIKQPYAVAASIPILYGQAHLRGQGFHAPVGSPRAVIMLTTMLLEGLGYAKREEDT